MAQRSRIQLESCHRAERGCDILFRLSPKNSSRKTRIDGELGAEEEVHPVDGGEPRPHPDLHRTSGVVHLRRHLEGEKLSCGDGSVKNPKAYYRANPANFKFIPIRKLVVYPT